MKSFIIQITLKDDMESYRHLLRLKELDSVRKNIEIKRLIEAGYRALHGKSQTEPVVNSTVVQHPVIESQQLSGHVKQSDSTEISPTFDAVTGNASADKFDAENPSTQKSFIMNIISSAEKTE